MTDEEHHLVRQINSDPEDQAELARHHKDFVRISEICERALQRVIDDHLSPDCWSDLSSIRRIVHRNLGIGLYDPSLAAVKEIQNIVG